MSVNVAVEVGLEVHVALGVSVSVGSIVGVGVDESVGVKVGVIVSVRVGVNVFVGAGTVREAVVVNVADDVTDAVHVGVSDGCAARVPTICTITSPAQ